MLEAYGAIQRVEQPDHLDVDIGIVGADHFDAQLVVLAVPPSLRALVAKAGRDVPGLPGGGWALLEIGPHNRCGAVGPQGEVTVALVAEVVHLLAHDVSRRTQPLEHADVLEHRRHDEPVPGAPDEVGKRRNELHPAS